MKEKIKDFGKFNGWRGCSTSAVYPTHYEALEALGRFRPTAKLAERINGAGEAPNY